MDPTSEPTISPALETPSTPAMHTDTPTMMIQKPRTGLSRFLSFKSILFTILVLGGLAVGIASLNTKADVRSKATLSGPTLALSPATKSLTVGETATAGILLNTDTQSVAAVELHLTYDPSALEIVSVTRGTVLSVALGTESHANGAISMAMGSDPSTPYKGSDIIGTITYKALKAGTSSLSFAQTTQVASIEVDTNALTGSTGTTITTTIAGSNVTPSVTPTHTITPTRTPTPTQPITPTRTPTPPIYQIPTCIPLPSCVYDPPIVNGRPITCDIARPPNGGSYCPRPTVTGTISISPSSTPTPSRTPTPTHTIAPTSTPTVIPGHTNTPTMTPTRTPTHTPTPIHTSTPTPTQMVAPTPTPTNTPIYSVADLNHDGRVNIIDFTLYFSAWFLNNMDTVDLNKDGRKSAIDYTIFMNEWWDSARHL